MENNIKYIWNRQAVPTINQPDISDKIERYRKKKNRKVIILNAVLLLTVFFIVFIWIYFKPQLISTKLGIVLAVIPISVVVILNHRIITLCRKIDDSQSNSAYLNNLLAIKSRESFMQTKVLNLYFAFLSLGIGLYMYEYTLYTSLLFGIIAYSAILLWIAFNWFYLRPRIIKKNKRKIDSLIEQIKSVRSQLDKI